MENKQDEINKPSWLRYYGWPTIALIIAVIGFSYDMYYTYHSGKDKDQQVKESQTALNQERADKNSCVYTRDSLKEEVRQLSFYKTLTKAMVHRDEAASLLKYKVGDIVYLKTDSTKAVISDIIIGGSKYEYYIRYRLTFKDKSDEDVVPELIY